MLKLGESLSFYFYIIWCGVLAMGKRLVAHIRWRKVATKCRNAAVRTLYLVQCTSSHLQAYSNIIHSEPCCVLQEIRRLGLLAYHDIKKAIAIYAFMAHGGWSPYPRRKRPQYPFNRRLSGAHFGEEVNILLLSGFKPQVVHSIA